MDSIISHDRLGLVNGILKEYNDLKEAIKYRYFKSIIPDRNYRKYRNFFNNVEL